MTVKMHVITNAETDETWVVPSEADLSNEEVLHKERLQNADVLEKSADPAEQAAGKRLRQDVEVALQSIGRMRSELADLQKAATELTFEVKRPTMSMVVEAERCAQQLDTTTGERWLDAGILMLELMPKCVQLDAQELENLAPPIYEHIWAQVKRTIRADPSRFPFLSRRSTTH